MKKILLLLALALGLGLSSCVQEEKEVNIQQQVIRRYPEGEPKLTHYFKIENEQRILFKEVGYYSCGSKKLEGQFLNGKRTGLWMSWYKNGQKWTEGEYADGKQNGRTGHWFEDGKTFFIGQYKNDKRIGTWKFYDQEGELKKEITY